MSEDTDWIDCPLCGQGRVRLSVVDRVEIAGIVNEWLDKVIKRDAELPAHALEGPPGPVPPESKC